MPNLIKDFFSWSKKERIGVIALTMLLLTLFILNFFFDRLFTPQLDNWTADSLNYYSKILDSLEMEVTSKQPLVQQKRNSNRINKSQVIKFHLFDPNKIGKQEWMNFGFTEKQAQSILNYKKAINGFKTKNDLGRCFVIDSNKMNQLRPYIHIDSSLIQKENIGNSILINYDSNNVKGKIDLENRVLVELNEADSLKLLSISGIGPYFSNKIIDYRNQLGGYFKKEQLLEIWNFDSVRYQIVYDQIIIEPELVIKLNINLAEIDLLKSHPYIRWSLANAIVKYRIQHGKYSSVEDVKNVVLMTDSIFKKLSPYLVID
jgi:competence protein ComEA